MNREGTLKALLVFLGLLFSATVYPLILFLWQAPSLAMMLGLYVTLGVFLLLAARDPSAHRSLLAFTAWSSFAHAAVMTVQSRRMPDERMHCSSARPCLLSSVWPSSRSPPQENRNSSHPPLRPLI